MLDREMAVEQDRFHFRERRVIAIDVAPARLHHRELLLDEIGHRAAQKICRRNKIGVENCDEFSGGRFQPFLQRAGFEAFAVVAMDVKDGQAQRAVALDAVAMPQRLFRRSNRRAPEFRADRAGNRIARRLRPVVRSRSARCKSEAAP